MDNLTKALEMNPLVVEEQKEEQSLRIASILVRTKWLPR